MGERTPWEPIISAAHIVDLHREGMRRGGRMSTAMPGCLDERLGNAWTAEGYRQEEGLRVGLIFACHLAFYLARNGCFTDGNKRVAWLALVYVLDHYGLTIEATEDDATDFMLKLAGAKETGVNTSADIVIEWVQARLVAAA